MATGVDATYRCGGSSGLLVRKRSTAFPFHSPATNKPIASKHLASGMSLPAACNNLVMASNPSDWQRYRRLLSYARPYRGRLLAGMAMLAAVSLVEPLIQVAFSQILDRAFMADAGAGATGGVAIQSALAKGFLGPVTALLQAIPILWFPALLVSLFAVRSAANFAGDLALHWVASRVVCDLRQVTFAHLLRLPTGFFDSNSAAELTSKITFDSQQVGAVTSQALTDLGGGATFYDCLVEIGPI